MPFRACAITDEFHPDITVAAQAMSEIGMTGAELRMIGGKSVMELTNEDLRRATEILRGYGLEVVGVATPIFKCQLPGTELDTRFPADQFGTKFDYNAQVELWARAVEIAKLTGATLLRVFAYLRAKDPEQCFGRIADHLGVLARYASFDGIQIGVEDEHCTNAATGREVGRLVQAVKLPNLGVVWDPANAAVAGEIAYPLGYYQLPATRILHVHAKNVVVHEGKPEWVRLGGDGVIDWPAQMAALAADGYGGWVSLETHWPGLDPDVDKVASKLKASIICGRELVAIAAAA